MANPFFGYVHLFSFVVPAAVGIWVYARLNRGMRLLVVLCILACANVGLQFGLSLWRITNYIVADCYRVVEVSLITGVLYLSSTLERARLVITCIGVIFALIWIGDMAWLNDHDHINSGMAMISRMFLIVMSLITLYAEVMSERSNLAERSVFWISVGVALYSSGTLLAVASSNYLLGLRRAYFDVAWHFNWGLLVVANLMYTKGIMCKPQV